MNDADLATAADTNLASTWASLGHSAGADIVDIGPITLVAVGIPAAVFNGAFLRGPTDEPERLVDEAIRFFGERNLPWQLWVRDSVSPETLAAGRAAGLRDAGGPPAMGMNPIAENPEPLAELSIAIATSATELTEHASMLRDGFGMPQEVVDQLIKPKLLDVASVAVFVGRVDGEPVSCSLLSVTGSLAGVYNVATPQRFRGRGYGEALTWAAIAEGARRGCTEAVLQASDAGYPIYKRMGFNDLGRYVQLEGPPPLDQGISGNP
jgi:ribosomal protein S18 acetylase RimI-like enzyme